MEYECMMKPLDSRLVLIVRQLKNFFYYLGKRFLPEHREEREFQSVMEKMIKYNIFCPINPQLPGVECTVYSIDGENDDETELKGRTNVFIQDNHSSFDLASFILFLQFKSRFTSLNRKNSYAARDQTMLQVVALQQMREKEELFTDYRIINRPFHHFSSFSL